MESKLKKSLVEIINQASTPRNCPLGYIAEVIADSLIENGVLLPKFKIGQEIWLIDNDRHTAEITEIRMCYVGKKLLTTYTWQQYDKSYELTELWDEDEFTDDDIGKTVFANKIEAKKAQGGKTE